MQAINEACILNLIMSSIFTNRTHLAVKFDWNFILGTELTLRNSFVNDDARVLLQLSLMTTNANINEEKLQIPKYFSHTEIVMQGCPLQSAKKMLNNKDEKADTILAHILYNKRLNVVIVVFTGTSNACLVGLDIEYDQVEIEELNNYELGMRAHHGFYAAYKTVRPQIREALNALRSSRPILVITGHSMGAALSNLCSLDFADWKPINYAFAGPRIFNLAAATKYDEKVKRSYQVANRCDIVTIAPLPIMPNNDEFYHVGQFHCFQRSLSNYSMNHTAAYVLEFKIPYKLLSS